MPEGDTIHRAAARLRPALVGQPLVRLDTPRLAVARDARPAPGTAVTAVEAQGKHLLIHFDGGWRLRTHLRMTGSWHLYRSGEKWRRPAHLARAVVEVPEWVAVCFAAPVVALERDDQGTAHLGPDLCAPGADLDEAVARMDAVAELGEEIGVVLLDQRVAAGVGNVYKSEVLFACGVHPFTPLRDVEPGTRQRLVATASKLLRANLATAARTTVGTRPGGLAVYGRRGQPCLRCGTPIRMRRQGEHNRSTYWCPTCQPPAA